ncbi:hypothetical protein DVH24_038853 [Malus domestica]|uniref:Uncharacterized protein n=1 Tax=Malus domestica TaxID=3750 RepID=A0A498K8G7_MALDO|nr:hypothetical protein DVH24_038853 [Malus domestica]
MLSCDNFVQIRADGIVINMVVGGEVVTLKSLEESSNLVIAEMPIHVSLLMRMFPTFLVSYLVSQHEAFWELTGFGFHWNSKIKRVRARAIL